MNKKMILIILGVASFTAALLFIFYEIKNVPDVDWNKKYDINSKEPHDLWLFHNVLKDVYGEENISIDYYFSPSKYNADSTIYLAIGSSLEYYADEALRLEKFIEDGGEVVLIGESLIFECSSFTVNYDSLKIMNDTSLLANYELDTTFQFINNESSFEDSSDLYYNTFSIRTLKDSLDTILVEHQIVVHDSASIYSYLDLGKGSIYLHNLPQLFTNVSSKQDFYDIHLDQFLSLITNKKIVISKPLSQPLADKSPLNVLLANKYFKASYYTFLLALLLFLIFGSKRKQKVIPIKEPVTNTSLEYVSTLSRLYEMQDQPQKLVKRMEENFYTFVNNNFFIHKSETQFLELLSKKTKVDSKLIDSIISDFNRINNELLCDESDIQLLYNKIEKFKIQSNDRR